MSLSHKKSSLLLACLLVAGAALARADNATTAPAPTTQPARTDLPSWGISFIPPAGWTSDPCPEVGILARFQKLDPKSHLPLAEISINVDRSVATTHDLVMRLANSDPGATQLPQAFEIDHLATVGFRKDQPDRISRPFLLLVTERGKRNIVTFRARGLREDSPNHELVALVKSVQWSPCQSPAEHLPLASEPVPIFTDGGPTIRLPEPFRHEPQMLDLNRSTFSITDGDTGQTVAALLFIYADFPPKGSSEKDPTRLVAHSISYITGQPNPTTNVDYLPKPLNGGVSDLYLNAREHVDDNASPNRYRLGTILNDKKSIAVYLTIFHQDETSARKIAAPFPDLLKTISFPPPPPPTTTSQPTTSTSQPAATRPTTTAPTTKPKP